MKHQPETELYTRTLELYVYLLKNGIVQSTHGESLDMNGYSKYEIGQDHKLPQEFYVVALGVHSRLSPRASKLLLKIGEELCTNNALWWYEMENNHMYSVIEELVEKHILFRSEHKNIFLVNPIFIRRGTAQAVTMLTMEELKGASKPTKDMIRDLRYTNRIKVDKFDVMNMDILDVSGLQLPPGT